jgi:hypothetical protein
MKTPMRMFGVVAGMATAAGYLPHIVFLAVIAVSQIRNITTIFPDVHGHSKNSWKPGSFGRRCSLQDSNQAETIKLETMKELTI